MLFSRPMYGIESILYGVGLAGVAAQAAAGVLDAGRKPFDLFGIVVVALAASLGGGSLRDLLLDRPVFWIADQSYLIAAMAAGDVMLAELGSSPTAIATSQGVDLQLFMLAAVLGTAESLIARDGSGIESLADLKGKKVGVPLGSTAH